MDIPVFVSRPSTLNEDQHRVALWMLGQLDELGLQARTVGESDFSVNNPLREVLVLARHCAGGIILGFDRDGSRGATPWNQLEAGILYASDLPLLVFADAGIAETSGGIFGLGSSDLYVSAMPYAPQQQMQARMSILAWQGRVREHYYEV